MKKIFFLILSCILVCLSCANAEQMEISDWDTAPVFKKAYEQSFGKIYIEWDGNAPLYQIFVDGGKVADVMINHHIINVGKGTHSVVVYPINEIRGADTKLDLNVNTEKVGGGISLDLAALGIDPKRLTAGYPSEKLTFDYKPAQIMNGTPDNLSATTDPQNRVVLSFADQYVADEYLLTIRHRNDVNYLTYRVNGEKEKGLITKNNTMVSLILDPDFLRGQECLVPELNEEYGFTVQLRKHSRDIINGTKEESVINESKVSGELKYKVTAAWKTAPVITFASQTADGEITIQWEHEDYGAGCEYEIKNIQKVFGVMTGEEDWGQTSAHFYSRTDINNGTYCLNIVPVLNGEKGSYSADANVEVKNEWVVAPELKCEQTGNKEVKLTWNAPANIERYHITVYTGDNNSLLRFVDMDYSKYAEFDVDAVEGNMEYIYTYDKDIDPVNGIKMKYEIYGIRHTGSGAEQKSAVSASTIVVK